MRAARQAIERTGSGVLLTARSEGFIVGRPDLDETLRRLVAFAEAGADCLYAPGLRTAEDIAEVVNAVAPKPVNVLVGAGFITLPELAALGVRRVSVGGALARSAWTGFMEAAREIAEHGTFRNLGEALTFGSGIPVWIEHLVLDPQTSGGLALFASGPVEGAVLIGRVEEGPASIVVQ